MADREKGGHVPRMKEDDTSDESAAANLWAVYISEAEKYDKALVESWKSDMEGMLIFAGLFSASLTAFLIESYKTLNPDSGDATVQLLSQISQQLAASANGSTFQMPASTPFTPSSSSLVCNALWFISLGFSLTCALIATLLEQWARDFIHKADMRSAPVIRARVYSYLYYGLKRFNMHSVVAIIPLLLHASLLFFFGGLVAFLIPVNRTMTVITGVLLLIITGVYSTFTLLPLQHTDSPYRTPLSDTFWRLWQRLQRLWNGFLSLDTGASFGSPPLPDLNMAEAMFRDATANSGKRWIRDSSALVWTMKSLADENELEPFVEAIPDVLWGPRGERPNYEDYIQHLVHNPEVDLVPRIKRLYNSCASGILSSQASIRRRIVCCKALWAIARLSRPSLDPNRSVDFTEFHDVWDTSYRLLRSDPATAGHIFSARAMMDWSTFCSILGPLQTHQEYLVLCADEARKERNPDLTPVTSFVQKYWRLRFFPRPLPGSAEFLIPQLQEFLVKFRSETPYTILMNYLSGAALLSSAPYNWDETRGNFILEPGVKSPDLLNLVEHHLENIIPNYLSKTNPTPDTNRPHWITTSVSILLSFWRPDDTITIPRAIIRLLNDEPSDEALAFVLSERGRVVRHLWSNFAETLSKGPSHRGARRRRPLPREAVFTAMWRLVWLGRAQPELTSLQSVLDALSTTDPALAPISKSIVTLVKIEMFGVLSLDYPQTLEDVRPWLSHSIFPADTAVHIPDESPPKPWSSELSDPHAEELTRCVLARVAEAKLELLAEFLEHCGADVSPYRAFETVRRVTLDIRPVAPIHRTHQARLANSLHIIFTARTLPEVLNTVIDCHCWDGYAMRPLPSGNTLLGGFLWLDDPDAREKIQTVFMEYEQTLSLSNDSPDTLARVRGILQGLDPGRPESDSQSVKMGVGDGKAEDGVELSTGAEVEERPDPDSTE
ncbi:hypothetical protein FB451DRAFT_1108713 [Mycena latifolia]|nr:hypothetical protein FB451DRAFT_1108713 [Mycena latifolia]